MTIKNIVASSVEFRCSWVCFLCQQINHAAAALTLRPSLFIHKPLCLQLSLRIDFAGKKNKEEL